MKQFSHILSRLILILFIVVLNLIISRPAGAQTDYIKIDYPTSADGALRGNVAVGGTVVTQVSWIGLYLFDTSTGAALTNASCTLTTFPNYQCLWDTTQVPDGQHIIKTAMNNQGIVSYSLGVTVTLSNANQTSSTPTPAPKITTKKASTPTPATSSNLTPTPKPSVALTGQQLVGRPDLTSVPVALPVSSGPTLAPSQEELITTSQLLAAIEYQLDQDKPLHLSKLEGRQSNQKSRFILFSGHSYPDSFLKITVQSQPLVMTAKADSSGNWQYILDKSLEPGDHEVFVEVNNDGEIIQSGPYPFAIAQAQATSDNPLGASLDLVDPQKQLLKNYLYLAAGVVVLSILVMMSILYFRKLKKMRNTNSPVKEASAL